MRSVRGSFARVRWMALAGLAVTAGVVAAPRPASACVICLEMILLPGPPPGGVEMPANRVAFRLFPGVRAENARGLALHAVEGDVTIPSSAKEVGGDHVFSPDRPLTPDKVYVLSYESKCGSVNGATHVKKFVFLAGPPQEVPATVEAPLVSFKLSVIGGQRTSSAKLIFKPDFLGSLQSVLSLRVEIDGEPLYGASVGHPGDVMLEALCGSDGGFHRNTCGGLSNVPAGRRQLKIIPDIVGVIRDPAPITVDIDLRCDMAAADIIPEPAASGCASAGRPGAPSALAWLFLLAALTVRFGRRLK
jgi:uncharacterized protein (TIGR03382 family)